MRPYVAKARNMDGCHSVYYTSMELCNPTSEIFNTHKTQAMDEIEGKDRVMLKLIITYAICGCLTAIIAMIEKCRKGEFDPYNADEDDEEAIGNIVLLWWLYIYQRLTEREGE